MAVSLPEIVAPFSNHLPVRIRFGDGVALQLPEILADAGAGSALVLIDDGLEELNPAVGEVLNALAASGIEVSHSAKGTGEPHGADVDRAAAAIRESGAEVVV